MKSPPRRWRAGSGLLASGRSDTLTGRKMEVPVRKIPLGVPPDQAANRHAMANPRSLDAFAEYARTQHDYRLS